MSEEPLKKEQENSKRAESNNLNNNETEEKFLPNRSEMDASDGTQIDAPMKPENEMENSEQMQKMIARVIAKEFSGPIPPPNIISGYEDVLPGAADRIIKMAEVQSSHRQQMESMKIKAEIRDSFLGVIFAFMLGIGCLIACVITVIMVPATAGAVSGSILGVTGIGSIVTAFLKNTRRSDR